MSDCGNIEATLARLEAKINSCCNKQIDEQALIKKAVDASKYALLPVLGGMVTSQMAPLLKDIGSLKNQTAGFLGELGKLKTTSTRTAQAAKAALDSAQHAGKVAGQASGQAAGAMAKATSAFLQVASLALSIGGIALSLGNLFVLGGRMDFMERYMDGVSKSLDKSNSLIFGNREAIKAANKRIDINNAELDSLNRDFIRNQAASQASDRQLAQQINGTNDRISGFESLLQNLKNTISGLFGRINDVGNTANEAYYTSLGNKGEIAGIKGRLGDVANTANEAYYRGLGNTTEIEALKKRFTGVDLNTLSSAISNNPSLNNRFSQVSTQVNQASTIAQQALQNINGLEQQINSKLTSLKNLTNTMVNNANNASSGAVTALNNVVTGLRANISALAPQLATTLLIAGGATAGLTSIKQQMTKAMANIDALNKAFNINNGMNNQAINNIRNLDRRLAEMPEAVAKAIDKQLCQPGGCVATANAGIDRANQKLDASSSKLGKLQELLGKLAEAYRNWQFNQKIAQILADLAHLKAKLKDFEGCDLDPVLEALVALQEDVDEGLDRIGEIVVGEGAEESEGSVLSLQRKSNEFLGVGRMPAKLPNRLIYPRGEGDFEAADLLGIMEFLIRQIDRSVGYLPQKIKVLDTNAAQEGQQTVEVEIHSFADFAREMLQLLIDTEGDGDVTNNMLVRCLYELGFIHQGLVQNNAMTDAVVEHLDFKHKWTTKKIPFAFDPYAGTRQDSGKGFSVKDAPAKIDLNTEEEIEKLLPKLLKETEIEIRVLVNEEKKSLNDILVDIKRDTAMAAAAVAERADGKRLEQLVDAAQAMIQMQGVIDRKNARQALTGGNLRTRKK